MTATEDQIRRVLLEDERRAPDSGAAMEGIRHAVVRRKRRRVAGVGAVAVLAAAAITVPITRHRGDGPGPVSRPIGTATSPVQPDAAPTMISTLVPTWLPAGVRATGRSGQTMADQDNPAYASLAYTRPGADLLVWVADLRAPRSLHGAATEKVTVAGRTADGFAINDRGYRIQVQWTPGHWLWLTVNGSAEAKADALRVANSIRERSTPVTVPLRCSVVVCGHLTTLDISGTPQRWTAEAISDTVRLRLAAGRKLSGANGTVAGHPARFTGGAVEVELADRRVVDIRAQRGHLSRQQLTAVAAAVHLTREPSFAWLNGRP